MRIKMMAVMLLCLASAASRAAEEKPPQPDADPELARQISRYVAQLNDDQAAARDAAEKKLLELAGASTTQSDRFLHALPKDTDQMPLAVRDRLARIRQQVEDRVGGGVAAMVRAIDESVVARWQDANCRSLHRWLAQAHDVLGRSEVG